MPIYEYHCAACDHHFDVMQKMSDEPIQQCPECGAHRVSKLISAAGFQLKGTGWYVTDFKNKSSTSESKTSSKDSTKTETTQKSSTSTTKGES